MRKIIFFLLGINCCVMFANVYDLDMQTSPNNPRELYIDLMKRCVANTIYEDDDCALNINSKYTLSTRIDGKSWPTLAHTMIGIKRLNNIHKCMKEILTKNIPGDCIETGVWRGGATIFMRAVLKAYGDKNRKVWVADSFQGLPPPNTDKYPADEGMNLYQYKVLAVSLSQVKENFKKYGLLDEQVVFLKGLFSETLPSAPIDQISLLRLDGDLYESTMDALENLYPKVSEGGFIIIDDYFIPACYRAVEKYRKDHNIKNPLIPIDWASVYWKK